MNLQSYNDQDLVKLYITGNENGLQELLRRHKSKIYTSIYLLVKDQYLAEDIFQDAFIKVINTLRSGRYNEEGKFLPWVMRIAHNLVIDYFRKEKERQLLRVLTEWMYSICYTFMMRVQKKKCFAIRHIKI